MDTKVAIGQKVNVTFANGDSYTGVVTDIVREQVKDVFNHRTRRWSMRTLVKYQVRYRWYNDVEMERLFHEDAISSCP